MKISKKCLYALQALLALTTAYKRDKYSSIQLKQIAETEEIPYKFLEHVMASLKKGGIVRSEKGRKGGYVLARPPAEISVGEVIRLIDGRVTPGLALEEIQSKVDEGGREAGIFSVLLEVGDAISEIVENRNFEDLYQRTAELSRKKSSAMYYI